MAGTELTYRNKKYNRNIILNFPRIAGESSCLSTPVGEGSRGGVESSCLSNAVGEGSRGGVESSCLSTAVGEGSRGGVLRDELEHEVEVRVGLV
jgi:hypothetical protein